MAAYATAADVQDRISRTLTSDELAICTIMLEDAGIIIDSTGSCAAADVKKVVSCRMVIRVMGDGGESGVPIGATQGSQSALGYSQSWTMGSSGGSGELYLAKADKQMLGIGNRIGSYSPAEER